ncbi:MAG: hypothetical protein IV100_29645 [Myxococcales bacterium]|nr:hypothetical protein [Myxococcales bacterium]
MNDTTATTSSPSEVDLLVDVYDDRKVRIEFRLYRLGDATRAKVTVSGSGTMEGAHALVAFLDKAVAKATADKTSAMVFLAAVESTPIRAQFLLGKWLIGNKQRVGQVSVVGAKAWERKLASAVAAIANFKHIAFHETEVAGNTFLGWQTR